MSTIDERIAKHEAFIKKLTPRKERQERILVRTKDKLEFHYTAMENLKNKKKADAAIPPTAGGKKT